MGELEYLALGYGVIWLGVLVYLLRMSLRQGRMRQELQVLERMLEAQGGDQQPRLTEEERAAPARVLGHGEHRG